MGYVSVDTLQCELSQVSSEVRSLNKKLSVAFWRRNLGYPLMLLLLLTMTCLSVFLVGINILALIFGHTSLPFVDKERENAINNAINTLINKTLKRCLLKEAQ